MGNQSTKHEHLTLQSQLHNPVVLTSECFIHKTPHHLVMQGTNFVDTVGQVQFAVRPSSDASPIQYTDADGHLLATCVSDTLYAGKFQDQPIGLFKVNKVLRTLTVHLQGRQQVAVHTNAHRAVLYLVAPNKELTCIGHCERMPTLSMTLAAGVDVTLGLFVANYLKDNIPQRKRS
ncbi:Aste57867_17607 [Aphanomyces stellatus]|uniref:Aste57867_17607 protein n=1 Tax=Aphanomyces stellatus TaxID=120398 RepID=A0A485L9E6_9STRA|nr:hypothetical protein As57867_017547 [Aphanomyces stellatus]VFT94358.1 Aste57867_17607 [Aphanomyces stellatus]